MLWSVCEKLVNIYVYKNVVVYVVSWIVITMD
jgi:hypothetical protein